MAEKNIQPGKHGEPCYREPADEPKGRWPKRSASRRKNGRKCYAMMVERCEAPEGYCQVFEWRVRITTEHYVRPGDQFSAASIIVSATKPYTVTQACWSSTVNSSVRNSFRVRIKALATLS
jgi:hypothetical protein